MSKPIIRLYESVGLHLIVQYDSGIIYSNQTGGSLCNQPEMEGILVPIRNDALLPSWQLISPEVALLKYFEGPKYSGEGATAGLDKEDIEFIEKVLEDFNVDNIKIDKDKLKQSHEAWVYVKIEDNDCGSLPITFASSYPLYGVLTWGNSD